MKHFIFILLFCLLNLSFSPLSLAGARDGPKQGFIPNDNGLSCRFTQVTEEGAKYFFRGMTGVIGKITFDDPDCMSDSGVGLDTNKMMINIAVSKWYSRDDANFATRSSEVHKGSMDQVKGQCIQSRTYRRIGIAIDYLVSLDGQSIVGAIHSGTVGGCTD